MHKRTCLNLVFGLMVLVSFSGMASARIIHVKPGAAGDNTGTSWANAKPDLQSALTSATLNDEIWVAAGTYKPTTGTDRNKVFQLTLRVSMYGGFAGTETARTQRNWATRPTILSGDIGIQGDASDNSYHIINGSSFATLDGFVIRDGYSPSYGCAGLANTGDSFVVANCQFTNNYSQTNGTFFNQGKSVTVSNCTFTNNSTNNTGAGICDSAGMTIADCAFIGNVARNGGGAIANLSQTTQTVMNCTFIGNSATTNGIGGAIRGGDYQKITNCAFYGNAASYGGAIYSVAGAVTSCAFSNNTAAVNGGAIYAYNIKLANCTFSGNSAVTGGGVYLNAPGPQSLVNCIVWGNSASTGTEIFKFLGTASYRNCDIKGCGGSGSAWTNAIGTDLGGNIAADPRFASSSNPAGPDGIWRTADDGLRLQTGSPCINTGTNNGAPASDILGKPRIGMPDIGAYEFQGVVTKNAVRRWALYR